MDHESVSTTDNGKKLRIVSYDYGMNQNEFNKWMQRQREAGWGIFHANLLDLFFKRPSVNVWDLSDEL